MIAKITGCKASSCLMRLPYHDRVNQTVPNAMHTIKDCIEKLVYLITDMYACTLKTLVKMTVLLYKRR